VPPVNLDAVTNSGGAFNFNALPAGAYHLSAGPFTGLMGTVTFGGVSASAGISVDNAVTVGSRAGTPNVALPGGLAPGSINMTLFLNSTGATVFPFQGATGAGAGNSAPFVAIPIAAQTLSSTATTTTIDLAGHFFDPNITNSAVTMNITVNGVPQKINL